MRKHDFDSVTYTGATLGHPSARGVVRVAATNAVVACEVAHAVEAAA
eukprot:COSAG02_NODE_1799_length_10896_cov_8.648421_9_plen_47_part_00